MDHAFFGRQDFHHNEVRGRGHHAGGWSTGDDEPLWFGDGQPVFGWDDNDYTEVRTRIDKPEHERCRGDNFKIRQRLHFAREQYGWFGGQGRGADHSGAEGSLIPPAGARPSAGRHAGEGKGARSAFR